MFEEYESIRMQLGRWRIIIGENNIPCWKFAHIRGYRAINRKLPKRSTKNHLFLFWLGGLFISFIEYNERVFFFECKPRSMSKKGA